MIAWLRLVVIQKKNIVFSVKGTEFLKQTLHLRVDFQVKSSNGVFVLNVYGIDKKC